MAVGSIVNLTVGKLSELLLNEAKFLYGIEDQVISINRELSMMNSFLIDMEGLGEKVGDERAHAIAKEIRSIAYEAEDAIETYILEANPDEYKKSYFKRYLRFWKCLVTTHQESAEIGDIRMKIAHTMEMLKRYRGEIGLRKVVRPVEKGLNKTKVGRRAESKEDYVVGLDEDINKLVSLLTTNETQIQVLSIVGMSGCGKTTLARKLYIHENVKQCFDCRAWVCISQKWAIEHVLLQILKNIGGETMQLDEGRGLEAVREQIFANLERRKYLIVLDDVWTKKPIEEILSTLPFVDNGSKIIVTTRRREVADDPTLKIFIHEPRILTAENSWELFEKRSLIQEEDPEFDAFKALGGEMLKRCGGLPLSVVALAGLLANKETPEEWEEVEKNMSSGLTESESSRTQAYQTIQNVLAISYTDLPRDIKPCFLYMGLFPGDYEIPVGMLLRMWIAEGFISSNNLHKGETLEDLAMKYLDELIGRSMLQVGNRNYDGRFKTIRIHDIMRDLCIRKAEEQDFLEILHVGSSELDATTLTQPRRTTVHSYNDKVFRPFSTENRHLRSLLLFAIPDVGSIYYADHEVRPQLSLQPTLENFKLLRVLNLVCIDTSDGTLPQEIGSLIHLRYFGLRTTNISQLPSSIGNLRNLLTLDYRRVIDNEVDVGIPTFVWRSHGIRHIYLPMHRVYTMEGMRFDALQHLQTLWVGGGTWMLDQLPNLSKSVKKLRINGIESNEELEAVFQCPSIRSDRLHKLSLLWYNEGETVLKNLEHIVNSQHLRRLGLSGRIDDISASIQFPIGIRKLYLEHTKLETKLTLEGLGRLPNLKVLILSSNSYIGTEWTCYKGMFSQLQELWINKLPNLEEWTIERGAMCQLKKLSIWECKRLKLPKELRFIITLEELCFSGMAEEFYSRIEEEDGEDYCIIQHIPIVHSYE